MTLFHYKAIDGEGKETEGEMEAENRLDLAHKIKKDGISIISVEEQKSGKLNFNIKIPFLGGVKAHDKVIFARNLGTMIEAGLPMTRALSIMERQSKGELKIIIGKISQDINVGETLYSAMVKYPKVFSKLFVSMVKAGEESGNLVSALKNIALQLEKSYILTKKVRGAMMYPAVILSLMALIGTLMMIYVVPTLSSTFESLGAQLPLGTRVIIAISNSLKDYLLWFILAAVAFVSVATWAFRTPRGARIIDWTLLHTPVIGEITKEVNSARTARTLSSLLSSGVDVVAAMAVTEDVIQNSYYKDILKQTGAVIQKGESIAKIFSANTSLYPIFVGEMIAVGEETGKIGDMLLGVAEYYEEDVDQKTKDMSSIIEPLLMVIIGAAVGVFAISMISPIYSLSSVIQ